MLRQFELLRNCGIFENFHWIDGTPDFERINLIYGTNGTGKTSLARALDSLHQDRGGFVNASIRLSDADRSSDRVTGQTYDGEFERIFVFSEGYVARSHNFAGETEIDAVLTLGERTVDDEKRIAELALLANTTEGSLNASRKAARLAEKTLDDEFILISRTVVAKLSRAGGEYRSNGSYSKAVVKSRFSQHHTHWGFLSREEELAALATVASSERQPVDVRSQSLAIRSTLAHDIAANLASSPVSIILDTLKEHQEASTWVEAGRRIHEALEVCLFCGGQVTEERKRQIEQHFSQEVEAVQRRTEALIAEIQALQVTCQALVVDGSVAGALFDDLCDSFRSAHSAVSAQVAGLSRWLDGERRSLENKRANVVAPVERTVADPPAINGSIIERVIRKHNERVAEHSTLVQEAAKKIELHILKESQPKVAELEAAAKMQLQTESELNDTLEAYRQEISALDNVEGDPLPSAEVMARELTRILGRSELSFVLLPDGKHYRVTRHGKPARDLSTGERTAITLIHFLENVKTSSTPAGKAIVVIDDPISSLDGGASMGISTYMWSESVSKNHIEQIFLLTHNFELFRQWDIQIDGLRGRRGPENKTHPSSCYELVAPHKEVQGAIKRSPALRSWPPTNNARLKIRSPYHHAFVTAAHAHVALAADSSIETRLDALLLYPNLLRRMLETFLAFKAPAVSGNFTESMREVGSTLESLSYVGDADALRLQLTRFTHANSHADSLGTDETLSSEEIGAVIAAVFTFMNAVDSKHFTGICKVIDVMPSQLLLEARPPKD